MTGKMRIVQISGVLLLLLGVAFVAGGLAMYLVGNSALDTVQTTVNSYLSQAGVMLDNGQRMLNDAKDTLTSVSSMAKSAAKTANSAVDTATSSINAAVDPLDSEIDKYGPIVKSTSQDLVSLSGTLDGMGNSFSTIPISVNGVPIFNVISASMLSAGSQVNDIGNMLKDGMSDLNALKGQIDSAKSQVPGVASQVKGITSQVNDIAARVDSINSELSQLQDTLSQTKSSLEDTVSNQLPIYYNYARMALLLGTIGMIALAVIIVVVGIALLSIRKAIVPLLPT